MAESLGVAVLELVADTKPLVAGLEKGKAASEEMATKTASGFKNGIQKAAIPAALAVGALVVGLHKSVDAAEADQVATSRLNQAYTTAGLNADKYRGSIDGAVKSSADLGFKSQDVKQSLGSLIIATGDNAKAMNLLGVAQDIARFKGIGLTDASKMLTMAMSGSQRATKQLGLSVQAVTQSEDDVKLAFKDHTTEAYKLAEANAKIIDKQKTTAEVVDLVKQKLHGQAQAYAETGQGMKEKMGAQMNLLEINIGRMLLPALELVIKAMSSLTGWMTKHATIAKIVIGVLGSLAVAILLVNAYTKAAAATQAAWNAVMDANPIGLIIIAIAALVVAFIELWKHSQTFRDIVLGVWHDVSTATTAFVSFFTKTVPAAFQTVVNWVKQYWPVIAVLIAGPFAPLLILAGNGFGVRDKLIHAFQDVLDWLRGAFRKAKDFVVQPFTEAWSVVKNVPGNITDKFGDVGRWFRNASGWAIKNVIVGPFSDAFNFIKSIPGKIADAFSGIGGKLVKSFAGAGETIGRGLGNPIIRAINWVIRGLDMIHFSIPGWVPGIGGKGFGINIPQIPYLAAGGIVTSPTLAMIGEAGPEAVIPLSSAGGGLGGGPVFNVTVNGVVGNERDVAIKIGRELQQLKARGTSFGLA